MKVSSTTIEKLLCSVLLFTSQASASLFNHPEVLGMACAVSAQELFTTCNQEDFSCFCASSMYVYAVQNCIGQHSKFNSTQMAEAFDRFDIKFCEMHNSQANITDLWSPENQAANPTVSNKAFQLAYDGEKNNAIQKTVSVWLGLGMIFYWVAVVCIVTAIRLLKLAIVRLFAQRMFMRRATKVERLLQRYVFWPAMFNSRHMTRFQYFRGYFTFSLPTRFDGMVVSVYILLSVIFMLTPYTFMNNDPLFQSRWKEMMRYSSDRSGILAVVQFPMLILFALRNNLLIWITGWPYSTFNTYHRAISRVTYLLLVVHAVTKHIFSASYGGSLVQYYYPLPYFRWGCASIGLFSLMIMMAALRSRGYELFYRMHQLMAIAGIICAIFHLHGIGFQGPLWISIAFWGADWIIRVGRILLFNVNFILPPLPGARKTSFATARVYPNEMIKVTVTTPVRWVCEPGQYVYLHTNQWTFIGGHPFSVLGSSDGGEGLELVLKAREGMTKRLYSSLDNRSCSAEYPVTIPVYVEGPYYGRRARVQNYDEGLFFAGGIGITGVLSYVERMIESNGHSPVPKTIRLFWSVRSRADINPISQRIADLMDKEGVFIRIFERRKTTNLHAGFGTQYTTEAVPLNTVELVTNPDNKQQLSSPPQETLVDVDLGPHSLIEGDSQAILNRGRGVKTEPWVSTYTDMGTPRRHSSRRLGRSKHGRKVSVQSFLEFVKAGSPDEDEGFDYGKDEFLENNSKRANYPHDESTLSLDTIDKNNEDESDTHSRRTHATEFMAAGFTDIYPKRRYSGINQFDEWIYSPDKPMGESLFSKGSRQTTTERVFGLIEPVGMDVAQLINHHFKHSDGSICVVGCGPDRMLDTLCWSCCEFMDLAKNGRVDYYEEAFRW